MARYELGGQEFARKGDAVEYIRTVLWSATIGEPVADPLVYALLERHPERGWKLGDGIEHVEVHPDDYGKRCFKIRRPSGELVAFSFRECFKASTPEQNAKAALRTEIADQITAFRQVASLTCALTGVELTNAPGRVNTAEVDHMPPATFDSLATLWAGAVGGWSSVKSHQDGQRRRLTLDDQRYLWQDFHAEYATLRMLSAKAHRNVGGAA